MFESLENFIKYKLLNKYYWRTVKQAICGHPYDWQYLMELERCKLDEMRHYFKHYGVTTDNEFMAKRIDLLISLNDIITGRRETYEVHPITLEKDNDRPALLIEDCNGDSRVVNYPGRIVYQCLVKVNMNNMSRFIENEREKKMFIQMPNELYERKARRLYFMIMERYLQTFWD